MSNVIARAVTVAEITDQALSDIEDGYAKIMLGMFRLRKAGLVDLEREELNHVISLFQEDLRNLPR